VRTISVLVDIIGLGTIPSAKVNWRNAKFVLEAAIKARCMMITNLCGNLFNGEFRSP
jgi:hypothetical protein